MRKQCSLCYSTDFRQSRIRPSDLLRLVLMMYPVRCHECHRRGYVFLPMALLYRSSNFEHRTAKPQKA
jgi:hypothetical protein